MIATTIAGEGRLMFGALIDLLLGSFLGAGA
jgi:hypothetical protein